MDTAHDCPITPLPPLCGEAGYRRLKPGTSQPRAALIGAHLITTVMADDMQQLLAARGDDVAVTDRDMVRMGWKHDQVVAYFQAAMMELRRRIGEAITASPASNDLTITIEEAEAIADSFRALADKIDHAAAAARAAGVAAAVAEVAP